MANTWFVVQKQSEVRLYCPDCWNKAQGVVQEYKQYLENKYQNPGENNDV
jgi:hypothetical protein